MTRTHKATDRDHVGLANGTAGPEEHLPRYFAKSGFSGNDPSQTKKQGSGKGNWYVHPTFPDHPAPPPPPPGPLLTYTSYRGRTGVSELEDYDYNMAKPRRRTNSFSAAAGHSALKTKFEAIDPEVIEYEEDIHGPSTTDGDQHELEKMSTSSSADTMGSVDEEEMAEAAVGGAEKKE